MRPMNRRDALRAAGLLAGGAVAASTGLLAGCEIPPPREVLYADDEALLEAVADTLLPTTAASPGARAAGVGPVVDRLLTRCRDLAMHGRVVTGLEDLRRTCREHCTAPFAELSQADRERLLRMYDDVARRSRGPHWFDDVRGLVLQAYFTSQVGATQALRYVPEPGPWVGCVPLPPGHPAWACARPAWRRSSTARCHDARPPGH